MIESLIATVLPNTSKKTGFQHQAVRTVYVQMYIRMIIDDGDSRGDSCRLTAACKRQFADKVSGWHGLCPMGDAEACGWGPSWRDLGSLLGHTCQEYPKFVDHFQRGNVNVNHQIMQTYFLYCLSAQKDLLYDR